jgi:two-component system sensor histidine kinase UhpB
MNSLLASRLASVPRRVIRPPLHEASFWIVQAMVVALAAAHLAVDFKWAGPGALPAGIPVALLLVPVGYAALRYGLSGSAATAMWAVLLWVPDLFLPHGHGHIGNDLIELGLVVAVAVFVGYYIDVERLERAQVQRAESGYRAAEVKYRQLFDTNAAPILVLDQAGTVLEANPAARALARREPVGEPVAEILGFSLDTPDDNESRVITIGPTGAGLRDYRVSLTSVRTAHEPLIQMVLDDVTEERAEGQRVRRFAELLLKVQEEERRRIARELHDEPLQLLVHLARSLERFGTVPGIPATLADALPGARREALDVADRLRAVVGDLRPPALEQLGLAAALRGFLVGAGDVATTPMDLQVTGNEIRLAPELELGAFRIAQEAVNNVIRHARADHLWLTLAFGNGGLRLRVADDGQGFDLAALDRQPQAERLGLLGMRERAALLGGQLTVQSAPGKGTIVEAKLFAVPR